MKRLFTCLFLFTLISFPLFSGDNQSTKEEKPNTFTYKPFETNAKGMAIVPAKKLGVWNQSVRVALVVGVSAYPSTSGLSSLKFGAGDSKQMAEVLRQVGKFGEGNIIVLNDDLGQTDASLKPTKENILRAFKTLVDKRPEVFLFYFSGHGFEINNENVVAPLDALMGKASDTPQNVLNVTKEIIEKATLKDVRQTMVFLDACRETLRAGKAGGGKSFSADFLPKSVKEGQGVGVLVGTNPGGYSYEDPDLGGGVFTHFLIKGISGEVQNRGGEYVTFNDLKTYVEEKMKFYTRNTKDRHEQIPYFKGDLTGDFLIAVGRPDKTFRV
ncbi:MAG: caspase family protein, partial [Leptospiraceae bacterium]|nr:caspase family protein [Leptospiraceae bacterium]